MTNKCPKCSAMIDKLDYFARGTITAIYTLDGLVHKDVFNEEEEFFSCPVCGSDLFTDVIEADEFIGTEYDGE